MHELRREKLKGEENEKEEEEEEGQLQQRRQIKNI